MSIQPGLLGKYKLQERLGQGGMAEVWKAFDLSLERYVAIKFLHTSLQVDSTFVTRFTREARAVASLRHPNIVQIYDFETAASVGGNTRAYMVMNYIEGGTLADYLKTTSHVQKFPSAPEMISLLFSISEALDYAHRRGVLHRDIKPSNILRDSQNTARNPMGELMLSDFGIAKIVGSSESVLTNSVLGTPLYISPEQARGKAVSAASDIYSLGVILYEMCTGRQPFQGNTPFAILQQHIATPPPAPEQINPAIAPAVAEVIMRCLAKEPAARFPSALALTAALAEALDVPLPERRRLPVSAPDIRGLPAFSDQLPELPTRIIAAAQPVKVARPTSYAPTTPSPDLDTPTNLALTALAKMAAGALEAPPSVKQAAPAHPSTLIQPATMPHKGHRLLIALVVCLSIALVGSGLGTFLSIHAGSPSSSSAASTMGRVGNGFFTSSGAASGAENLGLNDTFQVRLIDILRPAPGKQYYAWLLPDQLQSENDARALGTLVINGGVATLPAPYVDPLHTNLIGRFSRFLVTEEAANPMPQSPSLDTKLWRYYAVFPQNSPTNNCRGAINQLSALCHLRHLLSGDPELALVNLQGGLNFWFMNNVKEVQKWAQEALDHENPVDVRHKIINMLYMLDGQGCIAQDIMQHGNPGLDNTPDDGQLTSTAAISLLDCPLTPDMPGYLTHIRMHLNAMLHSPGVQSDQVALATQIDTELNMLNEWLKQVQSDARQLIALDNAQLMQTDGQNMRSEIETLATNVLSGGTDSTTGMLVPGAASIADQIQQVATMDVMRYTISG